MSEIKAYWYRRGFININKKFKTKIEQFDDLQFNEFKDFVEFIYFKLKKIKHINSIENAHVNKLIVSDIARKLKILTPSDLIFTDSLNLVKKLSEKGEYITKLISGNCIHSFYGFTLYNYTTKLTLDMSFSETFFPSLIQNKISKKYELRIFYLNKSFYSMAIFSQNDDYTKVDFRNYNEKKINRCVPFKIPSKIEIKLTKLMKELELNCGSIDMIVTHKN